MEVKEDELQALKSDMRVSMKENEEMVNDLKEKMNEKLERKDKEIDLLKVELKTSLARIGKENVEVVGKVSLNTITFNNHKILGTGI